MYSGMRLMLASCLLVGLPVLADEAGTEAPWSVNPRHPVFAPSEPSTETSTLAQKAVRFYQRRISPHDGPRCPLYPTCSEYGRQAFGKHGFVVGLLLTVDRLLGEIDMLKDAPDLQVHGVFRGHDPLEANDFWFAAPRPARPAPPRWGHGREGPGFQRNWRLRLRPRTARGFAG